MKRVHSKKDQRHKKLFKIGLGVLGGIVLLYFAFGVVLFSQFTKLESEVQYPQNNPSHFDFKEDMEEHWEAVSAFDFTQYEVENYKEVYFPSLDKDISLSAWYVPTHPQTTRTKDATIIVIHGHQQTKGRYRQLITGGMLHRNGYNVLLLDLRNNGDSDRTTGRTTLGNTEYLDVIGAKLWLQQRGEHNIGLLGISLGAATGLIALGYDPELQVAWLDSPYTSLENIMKEELHRLGFPGFLWYPGYIAGRVFFGTNLLAHPPLDVLQSAISAGKGFKYSIMLVHATDDQRVRIAHSKAILPLLASEKSHVYTWFYEAATHATQMIDAPYMYEKKLVAFFDEAFGIKPNAP